MTLRDSFLNGARTAMTIAKNGGLTRSITIVDTDAGTYDPATGEVTESNVTYEVEAIKQSYTSRERVNQLIADNDIKFLFPVDDLAVTPKNGWRLIFDGVRCEIIRVSNDDGNDIMWTLQVRIP